MKINEIIREKRIAKGLTQEQVACHLGVSTPAVNKWEKAISYPDITLLPALCRLLDTDVNTLLSFKNDLSEKEISDFLNELHSVATKNSLDKAFNLAMEKLREYPSCDMLWLNTALTLDGLVSLYCENSAQDYKDTIETLYLQAAESSDTQVRNQAKAMLSAKYLERNENEKAEKLLDELPEQPLYDKTHLQANLYLAEEKWAKAALLMERKILSDISSVQSSLFALVDIACKENRISDAKKIADTAKKMVELFDLWEFSSYVAEFQISVYEKDSKACLSILKDMLPEMLKKWQLDASPLYRHIPEKKDENLGELMLPKIISDLADDNNPIYDFLRDDPDVRQFIEDFKMKML